MEGNKHRKESGISDRDIDKDSCILCYNELKFFALGACGHTNVCHTCSLRMRFILEAE